MLFFFCYCIIFFIFFFLREVLVYIFLILRSNSGTKSFSIHCSLTYVSAKTTAVLQGEELAYVCLLYQCSKYLAIF